MTLQVELVVPDGEVWAGKAQMVIAKTLDGDLGVLSGHAPVLGILAVGSLVRIRPESEDAAEVTAAVSDGFFSVSDNNVSILAREARLGSEVDTEAAQAALDAILADAGSARGEESAEGRYYRAQLRAAGSGS
ncbi:MAG TPA: F0F1 ATP synthase subunit epsilon [Streptosporangiaceae bacterium]|jgi:F-type H+-transporting ATPase subunit epsilon